MRVVVDASIALKWFVAEAGSDEAATLLTPLVERLAPDLIVPELCNAAWKLLRRQAITLEQFAAVTGRSSQMFERLSPSSALAARAGLIARQLDHPVCDAFYLALAEWENAPMVTADRRLFDRVRSTPWEPLVNRLGCPV